MIKKFRVTFTISCYSYWDRRRVLIWLERILCVREMATVEVEDVTE